MTRRRRVGRKGLIAICAAAAVGTLTLTTAGMAQTPKTLGQGYPDVTPTSFVPHVLSTKPVEVVVQLSGKSVAEVEASFGRKLSRAEKDQVKQQLKAKQDSLLGAIQAQGGVVLNQF